MTLFLIILALIFGGSEVHADPASKSRIVAVVNKSIISHADLKNRLRFAAMSSGLEPTPENLSKLRPQILRMMIDEQLQLQIGDKYGIDIPEKHVMATIKDIEESNGMPSGATEKMMAQNNIPMKTLENQIKAQVIWGIYIREKYPLKSFEDQVKRSSMQELTPSLQIADWEIDQEMKRQEEKDTKVQVHLAEIFLPVESPEQEAQVQESLKKLIEELQRGAHFMALAQQFSQSPTASQGGDMGWLTEDQLDPEVREAISQLQPGQLSQPIRTSQGHLILAFIEKKLPGSEGNVLLNMQQVMMPFPQNPTEDEARHVMITAAEVGSKAKSCEALAKLATSQVPETQTQMAKEAPISSFPPALQAVVQELPINQTSEPLLTEEGALLVMVCDKKTQEVKPFSRKQAQSIVAARKYELIARRELRDMRRQAFIDVRM